MKDFEEAGKWLEKVREAVYPEKLYEVFLTFSFVSLFCSSYLNVHCH